MPAGTLHSHIVRVMAIFRVQLRWSGFPGAPGYSAFHFDAPTEGAGASAQNCADAVRALALTWQNYLPGGVRIAVEAEVQVLDETTGQLQEFVTVTPGADVSGSGTGNYSSAVGAVLIWNTAGVRRGRRIQGRTFVVPLANTAFANDGTLGTTTQQALQTGASAFANDVSGPVVWARPTGPGAADGQIASITASRVPDLTAVLRSRRD